MSAGVQVTIPAVGGSKDGGRMEPSVESATRQRIVQGSSGSTPKLELGPILLVGTVLLYLGAVLVVPLAALVVESVRAGLGEISAALATPGAWGSLRRSLALVGIAVVVNGAFGVAAAIVFTRHRFVGRQALDATVDLTLALSPVVIGLAFLLVLGRGGWLHPVLAAVDVPFAFAFGGLVVATLFVTLPFTVREVAYVLEELGTEEEQVAATLGASPWQTFVRVTLPNVRPALTIGLTLTAARALGEFGAVLVLGGAIAGRTDTATTFIYAMTEERHEAAAFGMALLLAISSLILLVTLEYLKKRSHAR
jgi:sulfate transport system permease protein